MDDVFAATLVGQQQCEQQELEREAAEWAGIERLQRERNESQGSTSSTIGLQPRVITTRTPITYMAAWEELKDISAPEREVVFEDQALQSGIYALPLVRRLLRIPRLRNELCADRTQMFALAATAFDNKSVTHQRLLQTLYMRLTGSKIDMPRTGRHWEVIGFQGDDPATDLRGVGIFGLLQLLYFSYKARDCMGRIFTLSQSEEHGFPLCVVGLNVSKLVLQVCRAARINSEANSRMEWTVVANRLYVGAFYHWFLKWKSSHSDITKFGFVLKELERDMHRSPVRMIALADTAAEPRVAPVAGKGTVEFE